MRPLILTLALVTAGCSKCGGDSSPPPPPGPATGMQVVDAGGGVAKQAIAVTANDKGFTPSNVEVSKGVLTTITFTRTTDETCAKQVVFPELKIQKDLPLNTPVAIDLPAGDARVISFQCGMGMFKGKIHVQ